MLAKDAEWLCLSHAFRQMWLERKEKNYLKRADDSEMVLQWTFFPWCWLQLALLKRHFYMSYQSTKRGLKLITNEHNHLNVGKWKRGRVEEWGRGQNLWKRFLDADIKLCGREAFSLQLYFWMLHYNRRVGLFSAGCFISFPFLIEKNIFFFPPANVSSLE